MGDGERISRRAVVKAGETDAEMMEVQKTFMTETSKIVERLKDAYARNKEQIEDVEGDLRAMTEDVKEAREEMGRIEDKICDAVAQNSDECEEYVDN